MLHFVWLFSPDCNHPGIRQIPGVSLSVKASASKTTLVCRRLLCLGFSGWVPCRVLNWCQHMYLSPRRRRVPTPRSTHRARHLIGLASWRLRSVVRRAVSHSVNNDDVWIHTAVGVLGLRRCKYVWRGGVVVAALDLQPRFESRPLCFT